MLSRQPWKKESQLQKKIGKKNQISRAATQKIHLHLVFFFYVEGHSECGYPDIRDAVGANRNARENRFCERGR
jgi:hypothetical protein